MKTVTGRRSNTPLCRESLGRIALLSLESCSSHLLIELRPEAEEVCEVNRITPAHPTQIHPAPFPDVGFAEPVAHWGASYP